MVSESEVGVFPIHVVAEMTGVPTTTLRYWEKTYGLLKPTRTPGGHRSYSREDVERVKWIKRQIDERGLQASAAHALLEREIEQIGVVADEASARGAIMILVAEKDPITAELQEYFLNREGYDVHIVLDGRKAVDRAEALQPDLIILDVILPGMNGLKVCEALKADPKTAGIPILVFSVLDVERRALEAGANAFLLKPIDQPKLIEAVKSLLGAAQPEGDHNG